MENEDALVDRAREGSEEAFRDLLNLHQGRVRAYLGRFLQDRDVADDLAQETFLSAYRSLATWTREAPFGIWLLKIAKNRALQHLRDDHRRRARGFGAALAGALAGRLESDRSDVDRELAAMRDCLGKLPEPSAAVVRDHYFRRKEAVDIAREQGKSAAAVWRTLFRVRQLLRRCVQAALGEVEPA